jgi:prepilin-type N-terminal cleavage/methylation domain-containing protein
VYVTRTAALRFAPTQADDEAGFSLIEVMIAMFIIGVGLAALASVAITSISSVRISRERQDAMQLASSILEDARSYDYGRLALDSSTYAGGATYEGREVHALSDGQVVHEITEGPLTANSWVTWTDASKTEKQVTAVVSWFDRGQNRQVIQSTRVAEARRGLPVPNFQVEPDLVANQGTPGQTICFDHILTNLGEQDSYSWQLLKPDGSGGLAAANFHSRTVIEDGVSVTRQGYKVTSGDGQGWFAWMRMGPTSGTLQPMTDLTSDGRPDSASPVPRRAQSVVRVCYTPKDSSGNIDAGLDTDPLFTVRLFSAFDDTVQRDVQDSLRVISTRQSLYLHHLYQNNGTPRTNHNYKLLMDAVAPIYTDGTINYDKTTGTGSDLNPGLVVPGTQVVLYDYQNVESVSRTLVAEPARLRLAAATTSSLAGDAIDDRPMSFDIAIERFVPATGPSGGTTTTLGTLTATMEPAGSGWRALDVEIPVVSATLAQNEYLRLRVSCSVPDTSDVCHFHYDVASLFESRLEVTLQ